MAGTSDIGSDRLVVAIVSVLAIQRGAIVLREIVEESLPEIIRHLAVLLFVMFSATAGAWRYLAEKLNYAALALEYRDARKRFERAERLLTEKIDSKTNRPKKGQCTIAGNIVHDLGMLALRENEAWLKARRERPLSPVVG